MTPPATPPEPEPKAVSAAAGAVSGVDARALAARVAAGQLAAAGRTRRVVPCGVLTALLHADPMWFLSYAVATSPGRPATAAEVAASLGEVRAVFAAAERAVRFELVDEASPGVVDALRAAGLAQDARVPLLVCDAADVRQPPPIDGVTVERVTTVEQARAAQRIANTAFGQAVTTEPTSVPAPVDGGSVLASVAGEPVATAAWTAIADGTTEIVGVATLAAHRGRGLGALVTARAVAEAARAGAALPWLTPGDDGADRVYRRIGFTPIATVVHLSDG